MIWRPTNPLGTVASVFGIYAGLLGMEHGFFETLQGNVAPKGTRIRAVNPYELPFPFGHEPAMTVIPNFLATGIVALTVGLLIVTWAALFIHKKHGGVVLSMLTILLLIFGGGFGPITLLMTASIAATGINNPLLWWQSKLPSRLSHFMAKLFPWSFLAALLWVPAEMLVGYIFVIRNDAHLNLVLCYPLLGLFALTLITGFASESERQIELTRTTSTSGATTTTGRTKELPT